MVSLPRNVVYDSSLDFLVGPDDDLLSDSDDGSVYGPTPSLLPGPDECPFPDFNDGLLPGFENIFVHPSEAEDLSDSRSNHLLLGFNDKLHPDLSGETPSNPCERLPGSGTDPSIADPDRRASISDVGILPGSHTLFSSTPNDCFLENDGTLQGSDRLFADHACLGGETEIVPPPTSRSRAIVPSLARAPAISSQQIFETCYDSKQPIVSIIDPTPAVVDVFDLDELCGRPKARFKTKTRLRGCTGYSADRSIALNRGKRNVSYRRGWHFTNADFQIK